VEKVRSQELEKYKRQLKLSAVQREVLVGILLGDAHLEERPGGRVFRVKIEQSIGHAAYVHHLFEIFREWVVSPPRERAKKIGNGNIGFQTVSHGAFRFYAQQF